MHGETVTSEQAAAAIKLLRNAIEPMTAAVIAAKLHLGGSRETQRRAVRAIVYHLRKDCGSWIVAYNPEGYWLTSDETVWKAYNEGRQIDAKQIIGEAARRKRAIEPSGQQLLFVPNYMVGVA